MLIGAALMDEETRNTVVKENPAALLALSWYWATDGIGNKVCSFVGDNFCRGF
jgi:glucose-6-phosphate isomerase